MKKYIHLLIACFSVVGLYGCDQAAPSEPYPLGLSQPLADLDESGPGSDSDLSSKSGANCVAHMPGTYNTRAYPYFHSWTFGGNSNRCVFNEYKFFGTRLDGSSYATSWWVPLTVSGAGSTLWDVEANLRELSSYHITVRGSNSSTSGPYHYNTVYSSVPAGEIVVTNGNLQDLSVFKNSWTNSIMYLDSPLSGHANASMSHKRPSWPSKHFRWTITGPCCYQSTTSQLAVNSDSIVIDPYNFAEGTYTINVYMSNMAFPSGSNHIKDIHREVVSTQFSAWIFPD